MTERRRRRVRGKVKGTGDCPRLTVFRSLKNVVVQVVDDVKGVTLVGLSSDSKVVRDIVDAADTKSVVAKKVGAKIGELAKAKGVTSVVFDRNTNLYHGRVKAVAEGAREGGLKF